MASLERDANRVPVSSGVTDDANLTPTALRVDPTTKRLKVTSTTTISGATITDIEDGSGDSIMDAVNNALQVNIVASSGTLTVDATGQGDVPITLDGESVTVTATDLDIRDLTSVSDSVTAEHGITSIGDGVKTVTTAGTDEALVGSSTPCKRVTIQALFNNTGYIAVGTSGVDATEGTGTGIRLGSGDAYEFEIDDLADIYIDATVNGEGVRYAYFN